MSWWRRARFRAVRRWRLWTVLPGDVFENFQQAAIYVVTSVKPAYLEAEAYDTREWTGQPADFTVPRRIVLTDPLRFWRKYQYQHGLVVQVARFARDSPELWAWQYVGSTR